MKTKILSWGGVSILIIGVAVMAWWIWRPQTIILEDGTKLTLVKITYGKHHFYPGKKIAGLYPQGRAQLNSTNDTLVVWIQSEHKPNQWPNFQLMVYDRAGTACVSVWSRMNTQIKNGVDIQGYMLEAFPRRDRKMILRVATWDNTNGGMRLVKGKFVVSNPASRSFPTWFPDPLPDTQSDGDLDVTLTRLVSGAPGFNYRGREKSKSDPINQAVLAAFHTERNGNVLTNWQPVRIETSDATGNHVQNNNWSNTRSNDDSVMTYQWGLWPDEKAWKLRVEMSRTSGFNPDEVWAVENIPVQPGREQDLWNYGGRRQAKTNSPFAETTLHGIHLKLFPAIQFADQNQANRRQTRGGFRIQIDPELDGMRMTAVKLTDEQGRAIQSWGPNGGGGNYVFQLQNMRDAKFINVTLALHKSRFVEFTVKPTKQ